MYGIGVYFALRAAMRAFRPDGEFGLVARSPRSGS